MANMPKFIDFFFPNYSEKFRLFPSFPELLVQKLGKMAKNLERWPKLGKNCRNSTKFVRLIPIKLGKMAKNSEKKIMNFGTNSAKYQ